MAEAIKNLKQKKQTEEEEDEDVVELSNSSSSEDNDDEDAGDDSVSVQETIPGVDDARLKLCVKMDPCLICAEPAVGYDSEGKLMKKIRHSLFSQGHKFNHTRLFGFLCKGLSIKPFGMVKGDWNFASTSPTIPWPFCERCEGLINNLAGIYNKLEVVKTELKERMVDGEEVYMKDELYSKHDVRFYNFRKLVLGVDFKGTVKGRMFQKPAADGNTERPTCFDESMFPPNDPGSSWANPLLSDNTDHDGDDECGDSSSADSHRPSKKPKGVVVAPEAAASSSSLPVKRKVAAKRKGFAAPIYTPETSGFMERCGETGKITYYGGGGVENQGATSSNTNPRKVIVFSPTPQEDQYQCLECGELVPLLRVRKIQQQQLFRHHFLKFHTDRFKCKICRVGNNGLPMDKEELLTHLETRHEIKEWQEYLKICQKLPKPTKCPTCGKLVKGGIVGLKAHLKTHDARPFVCSVCGQSYSDKCDCNGHMEKEHPDGKWDPFACKYPGCGSSLDCETSLRDHIQEEHGDCEEARRLMCFQCGKVFNIPHGVKRHVKTVHEGLLEFECSQCSRK